MARRACAALLLSAASGWLGACQTEAPPAPQATPVVERPAPVPEVAWASAPDCRAKLELVEEAARSGRLAAGERLPVVVVLPEQPDDWLAAPKVTFATDLPLAVHARSELAQLDAPCVLLVDQPRDQQAEHRIVARDTVRSFYQSGLRSERNPEYDLAQLRVRKAERETKDTGLDILTVGDPMLDLVGTLVGSLVSGFSEGQDERELEEAMVELTSTPRSLDRPVYRAYELEQMTVRARKEATIPIALLDRASGRVWRAELRQHERREFAIIDGLDPRDRDYEARRAASMTREEFERWQRAPPRLQLSALAAALHDGTAPAQRSRVATPAPAPAGPGTAIVAIPDRRGQLADGADAALALPAAPPEPPALTRSVAMPLGGWQDQRAAATTEEMPTAVQGGARAAAVVGILADRNAGSGVYVRDDLVLTTAALVGTASVVDVVGPDGARVLGLVARKDPEANLALVQVARLGAPVAVHDAPGLAAGRRIEGLLRRASGAPTIVAGRYLGTGEGLAALIGLVQIDAPGARDQPEATPWFFGDALLALGTSAETGEPDGPLSAIGATDIADFLYGAGGALAALP